MDIAPSGVDLPSLATADQCQQLTLLEDGSHVLSTPQAPPGVVQQGFPGVIDAPGDEVMAYVRAAVSDSTRRAYRADLDNFLGWGGAIPASDKSVAQYLVAHAGVLSVATLTRRLVLAFNGV
jgi:hypothetical protein